MYRLIHSVNIDIIWFLILGLAFTVLVYPGTYSQAQNKQPKDFQGISDKNTDFKKSFIITAANPLAAKAGYEILRQGGSAIDAAIAAQMVLGLVEGQSSGIGGDAELLYWDASQKKILAIEGRVKAPLDIDEDLFYDKFGERLSRKEASFGGLAVGTPTLLRVLEQAHKRYGKIHWSELFTSAITLATDGFPVSPRLHNQIKKNKRIRKNSRSKKYFFSPNGEPRPIGYNLVNKAYAKTLEHIAKKGARGFYEGELPDRISKAVQDTPINSGFLTAADIRNYHAEWVKPICFVYRDHKICGMPPPSTGGLTIAMTLKMLERFDLKSLSFKSAIAHHLYIEAYRLAHADRTRYIGDPKFYQIPVTRLLNKKYLMKRSQRINASRRSRVSAGAPPNSPFQNLSGDDSTEPPSTTHLSIVDKYGNAISLTSSLGRSFGTGVMVDGFLLNSQLLGFGFRPTRHGKSNINKPEGGKRPRTSKSPTMVFNADGSLKLVIGSPGGGRITNYVTQKLIAVIDWRMNIQQAVSLPHILPRRQWIELERGTVAEQFQETLEQMGHWVKIRSLTSGLHGVEVTPRGLIGGADSRREGIVMGN